MEEPCYTCRRRRIRCDQSQSPCVKCATSGYQCFASRPLRWVEGLAIRGKLRGVSLATKSASPAKKAKPRKESDSSDDSLASASESALSVVRSPESQDNESICGLFIVYDSDRNPLRALMSLALLDHTLLKSVLALAARHRVNRHCSFRDLTVNASSDQMIANSDALRFKYQAIQGIAQALGDAKSRNKDETVASIFLLVFLDLLESGSDRWNVHLEGAKRLLEPSTPDSQAVSRHDSGQTIEDLRNFLASQIYSIETLGGTFVRPKLLSQYDLLGGPQFQETVEQSFLGCPEYLLDAIRYLSARRDTIASSECHDDSTWSYFIEDTTSMIDFIQQFDCSVWASSLPYLGTTPPRDTRSLCTLAQSYKIGALIYGKRVLGALTKECLPLEDLLQELLATIERLQNDESLYKCILWPIIIAGLECQRQEQRDSVRTYMESFWEQTKCVNVINASKIIEDRWQRCDGTEPSHWIFSIGHLGRDWLLI
ncbi:C6 transcription factor Acr-2 [Aspergillus luchuensis]|uniref:C6 transcription factor Acr-2 n=1 Tax=Aspergillus kawachii TaxID=1069201 RepID=A0A146FJE8_ASPKA|nr:C6 transcription factor Acr-2 [Aspergillus luchuensis]